ncbi:MAG: Gfo/Idh/MocA family protein [Chloroflexota bacterium]
MSASGRPVHVGIAGLGRSGWGIHARTIQGMPERFRVVAAMDALPERQEEARRALGCRAHADFEALLRDDEVEVVVVSMPNRLHAEYAQRALAAGRHVVVEKPFALTAAEADRTIEAARRAGKVVVPFQNRRYEPHFQQVQAVVASGVLGELLLVRLCSHSFARRWDWQTLLKYGGGQLSNNGPHVLDQAVQFLGEGEVELFADLRNGLSSGDAEDHAVVMMKAQTGPTVHVEVTTCAALPLDRWQILGTGGGLRGTSDELTWRWVDWGAMPPRPVDEAPTPDRSYNRETLAWQEGSWKGERGGTSDNQAFYADFYRTLREGAPLAITPESARRHVEILERCRQTYRPQRARASGVQGSGDGVR